MLLIQCSQLKLIFKNKNMTQKNCASKKGTVKPCGVNKPVAKGKKMASRVDKFAAKRRGNR